MVAADVWRLLSIMAIGTVAGATGLGIGAFLAFLMRNVQRFYSAVLCLAAGGVSTLVFTELLMESVEMGGWLFTWIGATLGLWVAWGLHRFTNRVMIISPPALADRTVQAAVLICLAISLHNFPAGATLGMSYSYSTEMTYPLIAVMILHSIPEGLLVSLPFLAANKRMISLAFPFLWVGVSTGFGAAIGYFADITLFPTIISILLGIAMGTIAHVVWFEMLRPSLRNLRFLGVLWISLGGVLGYGLTRFI